MTGQTDALLEGNRLGMDTAIVMMRSGRLRLAPLPSEVASLDAEHRECVPEYANSHETPDAKS